MELVIESEESLLQQVGSYLRKHNIESYLVGGFVRDMLLGRETADVDIAVNGDALKIAGDIAALTGGTFVLLDDFNRIARVAVSDKKSADILTLDFTSVRGNIEQDLRERDFTVDALAIDISRVKPEFLCFNKIFLELVEAPILDVTGGLDDLHGGVIRAVSRDIFNQDAVRLLRAVRLMAELDFSIDAETEALIKKDCRLISGISGERIREELFRLLAVPDSGKLIKYLDELGLLTVIIPELETARDTTQPSEHYWNVLEHSLNTVITADYIIRRGNCDFGNKEILEAVPWSETLAAHFEGDVGSRSTRSTLLKISALLHDIAKPQTKTLAEAGRVRFLGHDKEGSEAVIGIMERLRFSNKESKLVETSVRYHMRPTQLSQGGELPSKRALYRYFRDTGEAGIDILFLSLADHMATRGPKLDISLWKEHTREIAFILEQYYRAAEIIKPVRLVDGNDLINIFGLQPGPELGEFLESVREATAAGEITSREEALNYIRNKLTRRTGK